MNRYIHFSAVLVMMMYCLRAHSQLDCDLSIRMTDYVYETNDSIACLDITVDDFDNILGVNIPMLYDTGYLEYHSIESEYYSDISVLTSRTSTIKFLLERDQGNALTLLNGDVLATVCFNIVRPVTFDLQIEMQGYNESNESTAYNGDIFLLDACMTSGKIISPCRDPNFNFVSPTIYRLSSCSTTDRFFYIELFFYSEEHFPITTMLFQNNELVDSVTYYTALDVPQRFKLLQDTPYIAQLINSNGCLVEQAFQYKETSRLLLVNQIVTPSCGALNNGSIQLGPVLDSFPSQIPDEYESISVTWSDGMTGMVCSDLANCDILNRNNLSSGIYEVEITYDGCTIERQIIVEEDIGFELDISANDEHCGQKDGSIDLALDPERAKYSIEWQHTDEELLNLTGLSNGLYIVDVTIQSTSCQTTEEIIINNQKIEAEIIEIDSTSCGNNNGYLLANLSSFSGDSLSILWSDGISSTALKVLSREDLSSGFQWVAVSDSFCQDTISFTIPISGVTYLDHDLFLTFPDSLCLSDTFDLIPSDLIFTSIDDLVMTIDDQPINPDDIQHFIVGDYHIDINASGYCPQDTMIVIDQYSNTVDLPDRIEVSVGDTISLESYLSGNDEIQFIPMDDIQCIDAYCQEFVFIGEQTTNLIVYHTDHRGCEYEHTLSIIPIIDSIPDSPTDSLGMLTYYFPNALRLSSTRGNDQYCFYYSNNVQSIQSVELYNRWGHKVLSEEPTYSNGKYCLQTNLLLEEIIEGVYILLVEWVDNQGNVKVLSRSVTLFL